MRAHFAVPFAALFAFSAFHSNSFAQDVTAQSLEPAEGAGAGDSEWDYGLDVAYWRGTTLIGAPGDDDERGAVFEFERHQGTWVSTTKIVAPTRVPGARFGEAVAMVGPRALVAASSEGIVYAYSRKRTRWVEQQTLKLDPAEPNAQYFGAQIAMTRCTAAISATPRRFDANPLGLTGTVHLYDFCKRGRWHPSATLRSPDALPADSFGISLAMTREALLVGAPATSLSDPGAAYLFKRNGSRWRLQQKLIANDGEPGDRFGTGVALKRRLAVVGAPLKDAFRNAPTGPSGVSYAFEKRGGTWVEMQRIQPREEDAPPLLGVWNGFGRSIAISGRMLAIAAPDNTVAGVGGGVFLFQRQGGVYQAVHYIDGADIAGLPGTGLALKRRTLIIGEPNSRRFAPGLNIFFGGIATAYALPRHWEDAVEAAEEDEDEQD